MKTPAPTRIVKPRSRQPGEGIRSRPMSAPVKPANVDLQVRDFPPVLKRALIQEADKRESNMNDVAVTILAKRFKVPFTPTWRKAARPAAQQNTDLVTFTMPKELRQKIKVAAAEQGIFQRDLVLGILSRKFLKKGGS
jgi:hypothetical protein